MKNRNYIERRGGKEKEKRKGKKYLTGGTFVGVVAVWVRMSSLISEKTKVRFEPKHHSLTSGQATALTPQVTFRPL